MGHKRNDQEWGNVDKTFMACNIRLFSWFISLIAAWMRLPLLLFIVGIWLLIPCICAPEFVRIGPGVFGANGGVSADVVCNDVVEIGWDFICNNGMKILYFFGDILFILCIYNCLEMAGSIGNGAGGDGVDGAVEDAYEYSLDDATTSPTFPNGTPNVMQKIHYQMHHQLILLVQLHY